MYQDEITKSYLATINNEQSRLQWLKTKYNNKPITVVEIVELLNISLIDEWLAEFNYFRSYNLSETEGKADFDPQFIQHEQEQNEHRHKIADRIRQLNGRILVGSIQSLITLNSDGSNWKEQSNNNSKINLLNRLEEQKKAVKFYSFILSLIDKMTEKDTTTYDLIKDIKSDEEQHVKDLADLALEHGYISR